VRLYYRPGTAAIPPHAALAEIGIDYELVFVESDDAAYRALNPLGVVPTLEDGDVVVTESAAILLHLGERFPEAGLIPPDRTPFYERLIYFTNTLQPALMRSMYPERYGTAGVRELAASFAEAAFDRLDEELAGREWVVGSSRTGADLFLFMLTRWGRTLARPAWDRPHVRSHFLRTLALPGVERMVAEQKLELPAFASR
jgi:glutathione S-transferase